jgi:GNAT superfamily N-acetyltransferase
MKLIDILKELNELSMQKGHATNKSSADIGIEGMITLISVKNMRKYDFEEDFEKNKLVEPLINDLLAKNNPIGEDGQYKLLGKTQLGEHKFYLIDTKAPTVDMVFVGTMTLEKYDEGFVYNVQTAFDLNMFQVHWSNVGAEYRGKGLGKVMYTLVYQYLSSKGYAMASDGMLFEGSSGMWRTYMPGIASYFGIMMRDILLPVTKADVADTSLVENADLDGFVAMENPPKIVRKIAHNVQGLSFAKGEYGVTTIFSTEIEEKSPEFLANGL